ncbi:MAG: hypothetical protein ACJ75R_09360, partial [Solirubrobacterales bacterium]
MPSEPQLGADMSAELAAREREGVIADLARQQHGVVSRAQLRARGFSDRAISIRLGQRRLHVVHRGVFAVGRRSLSSHGRWLAGVLAAGAGAVLSHRAAGALWNIIRWAGEVDVTAPTRRSSRRGLRFHEGAIAEYERSIEDGIPVTTPARTLIDLASVLDRDRLRQAVAKAEALELTDRVGLPSLLERHRGRRGTRALREIVADRRLGLDVARSELEIHFGAFLRERGLPRPEMNTWLEVGGTWIQVDCLWRDEGVVVELDSRAHHADWDSAEADRARDRALIAHGLIPIRVTWRAIHLGPDRLEAELGAALLR